MVAIPTYIYVGDEQINGGDVQPTTEFPSLWGIYRNNPKFSRVVPSGADGLTGGTFDPYWDGSVSAGAGAFVKYHHINSVTNLFPLVAGAQGDNWYFLGGGITPMTLLMNALWERHPTGFKVLKLATTGGFGTGWRPGDPGYVAMMAEWALMEAAVGADTLDLKAVIVDASMRDIKAANLSLGDHLQLFIDGVRDDLSPTALIVVVAHRWDMVTSIPGAAALAYNVINEVVAENENCRVFSMNWARIGSDNPVSAPVSGPLNLTYELEDIIQTGARLGRVIDAFYTPVPVSGAGRGIATYVMIGDSQWVGIGLAANLVYQSGQESLLGTVGGTERTGQYIWNGVTEMVELYDILSNTNTLGTVAGTVGPESTLLKQLAREHDDGVLVFKWATNGAPLTSAADTAGAGPAVKETAALAWEDIKDAWEMFTAAVIRDIGRTPDVRGVFIGIGTNDCIDDDAATEFATEAPLFIDSVRNTFTTRTDGEDLPVCWLQPAPHVTEVEGGTVYGLEAARASVRATVASLPQQRDSVSVLLDPGDTYELIRGEWVHYAAEATYQIGYDGATALLELQSAEGETATAEESSPSGAATFEVETGSGSDTANAYCTVAFADTYHQTYGNPATWSGATLLEKQDAIRVASQAMDLRYGSRWMGIRYSSDQALDWPRVWVTDAAGNEVDSDEVPIRVQQAAAKAALLHLDGEVLLPATTTTGDVSSESKTLPGGLSKSVTYIGGKPASTQFPVLDRMLETAGLIEGGAGWGYSDA